MPIDAKRINGPENSISLLTFAAKNERPRSDQPVRPPRHFLDGQKKRLDGRKADELRPFFLKTKVVSQANGSAYIETGDTKVICAVYGPREIAKRHDFQTNGQIFCEFKYAPFSCARRRSYQQDNEERELSRVLKETLEPAVCLYKFPKAQVDVYVTVLDNAGSAFASAITVVGAALVNAGIPMYDILIGCNLHCYGDHLLVDPTIIEEDPLQGNIQDGQHGTICRGNVTLGLMPSLQQVASLLQDGSLEKHTVVQAVKLLTDSCHQLQPIIQQNMIASWKRESKEKDDFVIVDMKNDSEKKQSPVCK